MRIAVLGAGVIGASIAYHLAEAGIEHVLLFDAGRVGEASTARSVGGIRTLFAESVETRMSLFSLAAFEKLNRTARQPFGMNRVGYLLLASDPRRAEKQDAILRQAHELGVHVRDLGPKDLAGLIPGIVLDDVLRGLHCPDDVVVPNPAGAARAYAELAMATGKVDLFEQTPIQRVEHGGNGFQLMAGGRSWTVDQVVIAVNAYAGPLLEQLGVRLAHHPYPRHVFQVAPVPGGLNPDMPMTVFQDGDMLLRFDGDHLTSVVGLETHSSTELGIAPSVVVEARARLGRRLALDKCEVRHGWSGLRAMTPDRRAMIGALPGASGAWCAIGCNGHGFMHAPAIGAALRDLMLQGRSDLFDLTGLAPGRFPVPAGLPPVLHPLHH